MAGESLKKTSDKHKDTTTNASFLPRVKGSTQYKINATTPKFRHTYHSQADSNLLSLNMNLLSPHGHDIRKKRSNSFCGSSTAIGTGIGKKSATSVLSDVKSQKSNVTKTKRNTQNANLKPLKSKSKILDQRRSSVISIKPGKIVIQNREVNGQNQTAVDNWLSNNQKNLFLNLNTLRGVQPKIMAEGLDEPRDSPALVKDKTHHFDFMIPKITAGQSCLTMVQSESESSLGKSSSSKHERHSEMKSNPCIEDHLNHGNFDRDMPNLSDFGSSDEQDQPDYNCGVSFSQFCELIKEDEIFIDYFNKFLILPVFGQAIYFDKTIKDFKVYPAINSDTHFIDTTSLQKYLYLTRFIRFVQTPYFLEYRLNHELAQVKYLKSEDPAVKEAFDFLKTKFLQGPSKMRAFRKFLLCGCDNQNDSKHKFERGDNLNLAPNIMANKDRSRSYSYNKKFSTGYIIYNFWLDALNLRLNIEHYSGLWQKLFVQIRRKYNDPISPLFIPKYIRLGMENTESWDVEFIMKMSSKFLLDLKYYWVPRYLMDIKFNSFNGTELALFSLGKKYLIAQPERIRVDKILAIVSNSSSSESQPIEQFSILPRNSHSVASGIPRLTPCINFNNGELLGTTMQKERTAKITIKKLNRAETFDDPHFAESSLKRFSRHAKSVGRLSHILTKAKPKLQTIIKDDTQDWEANNSCSEASSCSYSENSWIIDDDSDSETKSVISICSTVRTSLKTRKSNRISAVKDLKVSICLPDSSDAESNTCSITTTTKQKQKQLKSPMVSPRVSVNLDPIQEDEYKDYPGPRTAMPSIQDSELNTYNVGSRRRSSATRRSSKFDERLAARRRSSAATRWSCLTDDGSVSQPRLSRPMKHCLNKNTSVLTDVTKKPETRNRSNSDALTDIFASENKTISFSARNTFNKNFTAFLDQTIQKMSTLALMNKIKDKSEVEERILQNHAHGITSNQSIMNAKQSKLRINIKENFSSRMMQSRMFTSNKEMLKNFKTVNQDSDDSNSSVSNINLFKTAYQGPGKSEKKKIRQVRQNNTFAFELSALKHESDNEEKDEVVKSKTSAELVDDTTTKPVKKTTSNMPPVKKFELNMEARQRAATKKADDRKGLWRNKMMDNKGSNNNHKRTKKRRKRDMKSSLTNTQVEKQPELSRRDNLVSFGIIEKSGYTRTLILDSISPETEAVYRAKNFRKIIAFQIDEFSGYPFREFLYQENELDLLKQLAIWVDIERLRRNERFATDIADLTTFRFYYKHLVEKYIEDEKVLEEILHPFLRDEILKLPCNDIYDIPKAWVRLQMDIMDNLSCVFEDYIFFQRDEFFEECLKAKHNIDNTKSVSFARYDEEIGQGIDTDDFDLGREIDPGLKKRIIRSGQFLLDMTLLHHYDDTSIDNIDTLSDDNGDVSNRLVTTKAVNKQYWNKYRRLTPEEVFASSKKEYPKVGQEKLAYNVRTEVNYMRSLRKQGIVIKRPISRPKSMKEIVKNQTYFEFFRRFLRYHNVEEMIIFWKKIEVMKNTINVKTRQNKAHAIMEKYFHDRSKTPAEILQCNASIILEISNLEIVTTSMLYSAQQTILQRIEINWFRRFCETFPEKEKRPEEGFGGQDTIANNVGLNKIPNEAILRGLKASLVSEKSKKTYMDKSHKSKLFKSWVVLSNWFRSSAKFIQCMHKGDDYKQFCAFLQKIGKSASEGTITDSSGNVLSCTKLPYIGKAADHKNASAKRIIFGQVVILTNLQNDLDFWLETDRFKDLFHAPKTSNNHENIEFLHTEIQKKAIIIKELFLEPRIWVSDYKSESYINVPKDICDNMASSIDCGLIDKTTFVEGVSYVFPILIHFWKLYRENYALTVYKKWINITDDLKQMKCQGRGAQTKKNTVQTRKNCKKEIINVPIASLRKGRFSQIRPDITLSTEKGLTKEGQQLVDSGEAIVVGRNLKTSTVGLVCGKKSTVQQRNFFNNKIDLSVISTTGGRRSVVERQRLARSRNQHISEHESSVELDPEKAKLPTFYFGPHAGIGSRIAYSLKNGAVLYVHKIHDQEKEGSSQVNLKLNNNNDRDSNSKSKDNGKSPKFQPKINERKKSTKKGFRIIIDGETSEDEDEVGSRINMSIGQNTINRGEASQASFDRKREERFLAILEKNDRKHEKSFAAAGEKMRKFNKQYERGHIKYH